MPIPGETLACWIIPAYAGSTALDVQAGLTWRDHPRIRGEHVDFDGARGRLAGSSPHTRGAPRHPLRSLRGSGIIPAYAGSTTATNANSRTVTDHPRIRGEHLLRWI